MNFDSNMNEFELKKNNFLRIFYEYHYIFEIQKCCGYSEWISVYKKDTIKQLYNNLNIQFATNIKSIYKLYFINNEGNKILVENNNMIVSEFIKKLNPIYPMPYWIVYKLYLDDGTCHKHHSTENINCKIHIENYYYSNKMEQPNNTVCIESGPTGYNEPNVQTEPSGQTCYNEPSGQTGYSGPCGQTGYNGPCGQTGTYNYNGPCGQTGTYNYNRPCGQTGTYNYNGPSGQTGTYVYNGPSGQTGYNGLSGQTGYNGLSGQTGSSKLCYMS